MNYKSRCWDLFKACRELGSEVRFALSAEKDRYVKHHRTFGGAAWVWLKSPKDESKVARDPDGISKEWKSVLPRREAAAKFDLMPERIGELAVFGDAETVFGELDGPMEELERGYRSHGSLHESDIPLIIYNSLGGAPRARSLYRQSRPHASSVDLARMLVSCPRSSRHNSRVIPSENLPFPSLAKRGENRTEKIPPLKKGTKGDLSSTSEAAIVWTF